MFPDLFFVPGRVAAIIVCCVAHLYVQKFYSTFNEATLSKGNKLLTELSKFDKIEFMKILEVPAELSNLQQELLRLYATNVAEEDLHQIKLMIGNYFAEKARHSVDNFLEENNIAVEKYNQWANEHNRQKGSH